MNANGKYQEFDTLTPKEFAALERSILDRGVDVAIVLDEDGNVLDGHHRLAICEKHSITDYPTRPSKPASPKTRSGTLHNRSTWHGATSHASRNKSRFATV